MNYMKIYYDICRRGNERGNKRCKGFELHHINHLKKLNVKLVKQILERNY